MAACVLYSPVMETQTDQLLTLDKVGGVLGVSRRSIQRLIFKGRLAAVRPTPGRIRVSVSELNRYMDSLAASDGADTRAL